MRAAWCDIDGDALEANARALIRVGEVPILAMVKADAYGHGVSGVVERLSRTEGVWGMGVALVNEAQELRELGFPGRILILGGVLPDEAEEAAATGAIVAISDLGTARALGEAGQSAGRPVPVHLKVDVGMHRLGVPLAEAEEAARMLSGHEGLRLEGVLTHLGAAHEGDEASRRRTRAEIERFGGLAERLRSEHGELVTHAYNSSALLELGVSPFDLSRPGLALYGIRPAAWLPDRVPLEPVLSLRARLAVVKEAVGDALVGYSQTPVAPGTRLGILPVGYGDGIPQDLGFEGGYVLFPSGRAPIIGVVSMDSCAVDLSGLPDVGTGEEALILGRGPAGEIPVEELARRTGRSTYELFVGLSRRLPRCFL